MSRKHTLSAEVSERDPMTRRATAWRGTCGRHDVFEGSTYEAMEDAWREHVYVETGNAPTPAGDKVGSRPAGRPCPRWSPAS